MEKRWLAGLVLEFKMSVLRIVKSIKLTFDYLYKARIYFMFFKSQTVAMFIFVKWHFPNKSRVYQNV